MAKIDTVNLKENKVSKHGPIRKYELPLKKRKIFKNRKVKVKYVEGYKTGYKAILLNGKPIISFGKKISNKIKGIKYDKDGNEIKEANRSRILAFLKKRIKKFIKKQARKKGQSALNGMQGVTKVALISIGGAAGITAAVAVPVTLANTIWKADRYITYVDTASRGKVTVSKLANDEHGNLVYSVTPNESVNLTGIKQIKKGDYVLHTVEGRTDTDFEKNVYEYTFSMTSSNATSGKLIIDKNTVSTHKGDIEISVTFGETTVIDKSRFIELYESYRNTYFSESAIYTKNQIPTINIYSGSPVPSEKTTLNVSTMGSSNDKTTSIYFQENDINIAPDELPEILESELKPNAVYTIENGSVIKYYDPEAQVSPRLERGILAYNPHGLKVANITADNHGHSLSTIGEPSNIENIIVKQKPNILTYRAGNSFDLTGIQVQAKLENGYYKDLYINDLYQSGEFKSEPQHGSNLGDPGTITVTISSSVLPSKTATFNITVNS